MSQLEKPIYNLLQSEPFFAHFLLGCRVVFDYPKVKTAAVSIRGGEIHLFIDTEWFFKHKLDEQTAVLKHEVLHLLLDHCGIRGKAPKNKTAANLAMDCAINQHISNLPEGCITLQQIEELVKKPLLPLESWEYYYEQMREVIEDAENQAHDHDAMHEGEADYEGAAEQMKAKIRDAAAKALKAAAGNAPSSVTAALGALNKVAKIPWKQQLRNFVSSARSTKNKNTRMKPNRRFELEQPGRKKIRELVLGVCTDSSGSVSDVDYMAFMSEINSIIKSTKITYLVHADCEVQKVDIIRDGKAKPGILTSRHGGGGTAYGPAIDECKKRGCDAIIYFGDFDTSDTPLDPGIPFIWVGVGGQDAPAAFGKVIRL